MREQAVSRFAELQDRLCAALENLDAKTHFREDRWPRPGGGGGCTRILEEGAVFERAAVNSSEVWGDMRADLAASLPGEGTSFHAIGVSLIVHPRSPFVPTVHLNVRRIERGSACWFGGGTDLTPYYVFDEDARRFHLELRTACEGFEAGSYARMKKACDDYFFLRHRDEPRGIGGIFFDYVQGDQARLIEFCQSVTDAFLRAYVTIVAARRDMVWGERERAWQLFRRGRYVEFNLLWDRGTAFGLQTGGRTESILASLPPLVSWRYDVNPVPGSPESESLHKILEKREWAT